MRATGRHACGEATSTRCSCRGAPAPSRDACRSGPTIQHHCGGQGLPLVFSHILPLIDIQNRAFSTRDPAGGGVHQELLLLSLFFVLVYFYFVYFVSLPCPFPATMSLANFLPVSFCLRSLLFFSPTVFPVWFGSVYLVTAAGFVAGQLI